MSKFSDRHLPLSRFFLRRLALAYAGLGLLVFGLQSVYEIGHHRALIIGSLNDLAATFRPVLAGAMWDYQQATVDSVVAGMGRQDEVVLVQVDGDSGQPEARWHRPGGLAAERLSVRVPLVIEGADGAVQRVGELRVASSDEILRSRVLRSLLNTALVGAALMLMVWVLIWLLVRRYLVDPLTRFSVHLQSLDPTDPQALRGLERFRSREFSLLRLTFIRLMRQVQRTEAEVRSHNALLESRVAERTQQLETANQAKSQFLANMSHEIRTPMNAILGMLALLGKTELTLRQRDYTDKSRAAAQGLLALINEILDFSKIEAGRMQIDPQPFELERLFRELSVILSASLGAKPVELLFDIDPAIPRMLIGDAMRLQQILINLGSNAVKFTHRGEVTVSVSLLERHGTGLRLRFEVRDTGIGIAPEHHDRIFSGFTQAEASTTRRYGGTGLGVAISQRFVDLMGGRLTLDSALGEGSCFAFELCLGLAEDGSEPAVPAATLARMLVVDDNPHARRVLVRMATSLGWSVDAATGGEQALEQVARASAAGQPYAAVFVDWEMPGMDGWQLCERLRALRDGQPEAPGRAQLIVMVTAHGREALAQRSTEQQALLDGYLVKPVTAAMLLDAVNEASAPPAAPGAAEQPRRLSGLRILLVEDNPINQQVARELLSDEGAAVSVAGNGRLALEALSVSAQAVDLVLMDLQMPEMDGFEATRRLREQSRFAALPVIAMTANALASDREACLAAGMNGHVAKPFDLDDLVAVIRQQLGRAEPAPGPESGGAPAGQTVGDPELDRAAEAADVQLAPALARLGGKRKLFGQMLGRLVAELPVELEQLAGHLRRRELEPARRMAHTIKGTAATLGATTLSQQAAALERRLLADGAAGADETWAEPLGRQTQDLAPALTRLARLCLGGEPAAKPADAGGAAPDRAALLDLLDLLRNQDMAAMGAAEALALGWQHGAAPDWAPGLEAAMLGLDFDAAGAIVERALAEG